MPNWEFVMQIAIGAVRIVALFALLDVAPAQAESLVPLKPGYYVDVDTPCERASNATLTLYTGSSFGTHCKVLSKEFVNGAYRITQYCEAIRLKQTLTYDYRILSNREYIQTRPGYRFHFRYCPQSELPVPWSRIDLSKFIR